LGGYFIAFIPPQSSTLLEGFFPSNNWRSNHDKVFVPNILEVVDVEDPTILPFFDEQHACHLE
jgi:hypothetical protein